MEVLALLGVGLFPVAVYFAWQAMAAFCVRCLVRRRAIADDAERRPARDPPAAGNRATGRETDRPKGIAPR